MYLTQEVKDQGHTAIKLARSYTSDICSDRWFIEDKNDNASYSVNNNESDSWLAIK